MDAARQTERLAERMIGAPPQPTEDPFTKTIQRYTAGLPSSSYLGLAVGAMVVSLGLHLAGRRDAGNFIAAWVPTWLIIGLYSKVVKLEGHDRRDRGEGEASRGERPRDEPSAARSGSAVGISNRPLGEERRQQEYLPPRGSAAAMG
jgi:hypothetical protein